MKLLIADNIQKEGLKVFEESGFEVDKKFSITPEELKKEIGNYTGIVIRSRTTLTSEILENAKDLKVIGRAGAGLDNVDLKKAEELKIKVFNTPEAPSVSVAELTLGLLLSLVRHIARANQTMHLGEWCKNEYMGITLDGKKAGLIGFGHIGQAVAKRMAAFGMKIGIFDILPELKEKAKSFGYHVYNSIDELVHDAQVITLHIPALPSTENIINQERINLMNKNTLIVNTARGALIDENALVEALRNKKIKGAALDVYREEPLKNTDLCSIEDNLVLTPHIGSSTQETQLDASIMVAEKIVDYLKSLKI